LEFVNFGYSGGKWKKEGEDGKDKILWNIGHKNKGKNHIRR
jgi:hypothetical protein